MAARDHDELLQRLVEFAAVLREHGVAVAPREVADAALALAAVDPGDPAGGFLALRCVFASRREDLEPFARAFREFWLGAEPGGDDRGEGTDPDTGGSAGPGGGEAIAEPVAGSAATEEPASDAEAAGSRRASSRERLRQTSFETYGPGDLRAARLAIERLAQRLPRRQTRRMTPSRGAGRLDVRRTLIDALHTDGVPLRRAWRGPRTRPLRLVLVLDVSGSMAPYAQALLLFAIAAARADRRVEAFTFGTRLTRVTPQLRDRDPERALAAVTAAVPDWFSGTQIGESLRQLNDRWGARGTTRGAVVAILSDGLERGDPRLLAGEVARLSASARSLLWVNPLAGTPGYEPRARGMAAVLPHVDRLLAGDDIAGLERLVAAIAAAAGPWPSRNRGGRARPVF